MPFLAVQPEGSPGSAILQDPGRLSISGRRLWPGAEIDGPETRRLILRIARHMKSGVRAVCRVDPDNLLTRLHVVAIIGDMM
jgi:hypothetical protein